MLQVAENYEAEVKLKGKVKSAMTYPVVVFIMAMLMCAGMLLFIVPVFKNMFSNLGGELPLPTQILVYMSAGLFGRELRSGSRTAALRTPPRRTAETKSAAGRAEDRP